MERIDESLDVYHDKHEGTKPNIFRPLVPEARDVVRRAMLSNDKKLSVGTAFGVLDRAGEGTKPDKGIERPVIIKDSQVNLLIQTAKEVTE